MYPTSDQKIASWSGNTSKYHPNTPLNFVAPSTRKKALGSLITHVLEGNIHVIFGRFRSMRRLHGTFKAVAQKRLPALQRTPLRPHTSSIIQHQSPDVMTESLCKDGVAVGLKLPEGIVQAIEQHASRAPCTRWGQRHEIGKPFTIHEVEKGRLDDGRTIAIADVDMSGISDTIDQIGRDPVLIEVIRRSFGYAPTRIEKRLFWSFATKTPLNIDRDLSSVYMPSNFHYDLSGMNALYVYFYITGASAASGAHVMIKSSQFRKPLTTILASRFHNDEKLLSFYGNDRVLTIAGSPGTGFFEDSSCFHKGLVPTENDRLMLQLRYY